MDPKIWGPPMWAILYEVCRNADNYPSKVDYISEFTEALRWSLPCSECRASFTIILSFIPPTRPYLDWVWKVRNVVNQKLQCPISACITLEQFKSRVKSWKRFATSETVITILNILLFHFLKNISLVPKEHLKGLARFISLLPHVLPQHLIPTQLNQILFSKEECYKVYLKKVQWALKTYYLN